MSRVSIVDMKAWHCGQIIRRLRFEHQIALNRVGRDAHADLRATFDESSYRKAVYIDGRLAAVGGSTGQLASAMSYVWMALTEEATQHPMILLRIIREQLNIIMLTKREIALTIIGGDEAATRLAVFLGFHVEDDGPGAPAYTKGGRRFLSAHLESTPELRHPIGSGYVIGMGYHSPEWMGR